MITEKELNEISLSPTKKDYYQIWNEIIELASKISERWSPDSTNESDPGIVLLKVLVAVADKLNYNIDKNILEAFMPSATQQESMRKLTEMMGYSMKYFQAATCKVTVKYNAVVEGKQLSDYGTIYFPAFINLKNADEDVNYVTIKSFSLTDTEPVREVEAMEGELIECETNTDNIISMAHLDDNNRFILPETNVAENGIFICNVSENSEESELWKPVDNLNTCLLGEQVFKFGFDSKENLPYVQFPENISQLIKDGLRIKYIRTNGLTGNISRNTLTKLEPPALWSTDDSVSDLSSDNFIITNPSAATNGANPESLTAAYNNFKKTIGTFDTLVTCRDYMNKIYKLTVSDTDTTPLVSNAIVSDIRDDINRATTLCSFNDYGICYLDTALQTAKTITGPLASGQQGTASIQVLEDLIDHFELILYPFKTIYGLNDKNEFINSFKYNAENFNRINYDLTKYKTIAHNISLPAADDIACIKNYLQLKCTITTIKKVTTAEEIEILQRVYKAIYENFNCRKVDFGEKLVDETIEDVIKNADPRIKNIDMSEPVLYTKFMTADNTEYDLVATDTGAKTENAFTAADSIYNKLVLRNILAGRIAAFQYDNSFAISYNEKPYPASANYQRRYPENDKYINRLTTEFRIRSGASNVTLGPNEVVQFRCPNLKTEMTYPCYVNYYFKRDTSNLTVQESIPATFTTLSQFMTSERWNALVDFDIEATNALAPADDILTETQFNAFKKEYSGALFAYNRANSKYEYASAFDQTVITVPAGEEDDGKYQYFKFEVNTKTFGILDSYIRSISINGDETHKLSGIYRSLGTDLKSSKGYLVSSVFEKFIRTYSHTSLKEPLANYYIQQTHLLTEPNLNKDFTEDGLGRDYVYPEITADTEYQLKPNEYILFNWTDSQKDSSGNETKTVKNKGYGPGTIIKPNFNLIDSDLYNQAGHSWQKKDGYLFTNNFTNPAGMFALGTDEQICIRNIVKVDIDNKDVYLYWLRNDENPDELVHEFTFDEHYVLDPDNDDPSELNAYVLKENEQLYYTDSKKLEMAFYGTGSLIVKHANTPILLKDSTNGEASAEDIVTNGLNAVPWTGGWDLRDTARGGDCRISVIENRYINLTEGDTLVALSSGGTSSDDITTIDTILDNTWRSVGAARYKFAESDADEPLPQVLISGMGWSVRSRLDINLDPETPQVLHCDPTDPSYGDSITVYSKSDSSSGEDPITLKPINEDNPLALYANFACQLASDHIKFGEDVGFRLKLASLEQLVWNIRGDQSTTLNLNNYSNGGVDYTKFSFEENPVTNTNQLNYNSPVFTLNVNIDELDKCGIIMFYYIDELSGEAGHHNAKVVANNGLTGGGLKLFNDGTYTMSTDYIFKPGINVIQLDKTTTTITIFADYDEDTLDFGKSHQSNLIFSELSLIKDVNPKLNYRYASDRILDRNWLGDTEQRNSAFDQLLTDIRNLGSNVTDKFYYNAPIDNTTAIDLNNYIDADTLASPESWYDPNNANNKFVVSEIDADYLSTGITLHKNSRIPRK